MHGCLQIFVPGMAPSVAAEEAALPDHQPAEGEEPEAVDAQVQEVDDGQVDVEPVAEGPVNEEDAEAEAGAMEEGAQAVDMDVLALVPGLEAGQLEEEADEDDDEEMGARGRPRRQVVS